MRFRFITGGYDENGAYWLCKTESGQKVKLYPVMKPYFYVQENEEIKCKPKPIKIETGYKRIFDAVPMKKLVFNHPQEVELAREFFRPEVCGEDDIRFIERTLIDSGVEAGFETQPIISPQNLWFVNPSSIKKAEADDIPLIKTYLDIEVLTNGRFPNPKRPQDKLICLTLSDGTDYTTLILDGEDKQEERDGNWTVLHLRTEEEMFSKFTQLLQNLKTDILISWGRFDWDYLTNRAKFLRVGWNADVLPLNLIDYYRSLQRGSAKLKSVVMKEGLVPSLVAERFHSEWYGRDNEKLITYNKTDVEYVVKIDGEFKLSDFAIALKEFAGLPEFVIYPTQLVDSLILRKYHGTGWVFPTKRGRKEVADLYEGGHIETLTKGVVENVAVYDMTSYYLSIIISKNLTFETNSFGKGLLPKLIMEITKIKKDLEDKMKTLDPNTVEYALLDRKKQAVKSFLLSLYGVLGDSSSRFFKVEFASTITQIGREGIRFVKSQSPYPVVYIHTDSLFIKVPSFEEAQKLESLLNSKLETFSKEKGLDPPLTLKFERFYDTILFTGVKARHAGRVVWEGGKQVDYIRIVGYEAVRGDTSELTREVQEQVLNFILKREWDRIIPYLREVVNNIQNYPIEKIVIPKTLHQEEYKTKTNYVRGADYARQYLGEDIRTGDTVFFVPVKRSPPNLPQTDVVSVLDVSKLKGFEIDYQQLIEKTIKAKVEDFLDAIGMSWDSVYGQTTLTRWR